MLNRVSVYDADIVQRRYSVEERDQNINFTAKIYNAHFRAWRTGGEDVIVPS